MRWTAQEFGRYTPTNVDVGSADFAAIDKVYLKWDKAVRDRSGEDVKEYPVKPDELNASRALAAPGIFRERPTAGEDQGPIPLAVYDGNHILPTALPTSDSPKGDLKSLEVGMALGADSGTGVDNASRALAAPGFFHSVGTGAEAVGVRAMHRTRSVNQEACDHFKASNPTLVLAAATRDAWPGPRTAQARPPAFAASPASLGAHLCGTWQCDWKNLFVLCHPHPLIQPRRPPSAELGNGIGNIFLSYATRTHQAGAGAVRPPCTPLVCGAPSPWPRYRHKGCQGVGAR